ncbi:MHC class I polypeptide-related sequence A-like, partial [Loxodonta africana]|uniref:MHC class I polypeptide-related sequence A-like n=1 Tax=Loxodonta africana TaxID=9785 RepID=UPI0030CC71F9
MVIWVAGILPVLFWAALLMPLGTATATSLPTDLGIHHPSQPTSKSPAPQLADHEFASLCSLVNRGNLAVLPADIGIRQPSQPVCLHSLRYDITVVSQDGSVQTRFVAEEYFDGKLFLQYDSEKGRAEPLGPWAEAQLGAETWDLETMGFTDIRMELRMTLFDIMKLQDQKRGESGDETEECLHSLQETLGCEIQEDDGPGSFWNYCYGKERFLCCHPETKRWTVPLSSVQTLALEMRKTWDVDRDKHKYYGHHVEGDICKRLRSYLDLGRDFMGRTASTCGPRDAPSSERDPQSGHEGQSHPDLLGCWLLFPENHTDLASG